MFYSFRKFLGFLGLSWFLFSCINNSEKSTLQLSTPDIEDLLDFDNSVFLYFNPTSFYDTILDINYQQDQHFTPQGIKNWNTEKFLNKITTTTQVLKASGNVLPTFIGLSNIENETVAKAIFEHQPFDEQIYNFVFTETKNSHGLRLMFAFDNRVFYLDQYMSHPIDVNGFHDEILQVDGFLKDSVPLTISIVHHFEDVNYLAFNISLSKVLKNALTSINHNNIVLAGTFPKVNPKGKNINPLKTDDLGTKRKFKDWELVDYFMVNNEILKPVNDLNIKNKNFKVINDKQFLHFLEERGCFIPNRTFGEQNEYYGGFSEHLGIYLTFTKQND